MSFGDLMNIPKRIRPTGPGGHARGRGRGGRLPNQLLTSPETIRYIEDAEERTQKKDKMKQEKDQFVKQALVEKSKKDREMKKKTK